MPTTESPEMKSLQNLLIDHLRCLHDIQSRRLNTLRELGKQTRSTRTREIVNRRIANAHQQIHLLDSVFSTMQCDPKNIAINGHSFHYEIANYATARTWAQYLGLNGVTELLRHCLELEQQSDNRVSLTNENDPVAESSLDKSQSTNERHKLLSYSPASA
jgi:ferritin-like metal-binding protein YciE